jgi:toxin CptA
MRRAAPAWLAVSLGPSRALAAALAVTHLAAAAGVLASRLPAAISAAVLLALAASLVQALTRHACRVNARSLVHLDLSDTLDIQVEERAGRRLTGKVLGSSFVAPGLVVIHFRADGHRLARAVVVPFDATDAESHRALRVWLRWRRPAAAPDA